MTPAYININAILSKHGIAPKTISHPSVFTCEEADLYIPNLELGVKTLLLKTKSGKYIACVISGTDRLNLETIKNLIHERKMSFAATENACEVVGAERGSIPPFGHRETVRIIVDNCLKDLREIYFNPGINTETYGITGTEFQTIMKEEGALFEDIAMKQLLYYNQSLIG